MSDSQYDVDVEALTKSNPKIDPDQLRETQKDLKKLRDQGIGRPGYGIESPYERKPLRREPGLHIRH